MLSTCTLTLPVAGCLLSGDLPEPNLVVPASYDHGPKSPIAAQKALPSLDWWTKFRSRELTALIEEGRESNLDIAAAIARIVQADAQARITGAALLPFITANGDATHTQASKTTTKASAANLGANTYRSGGDIVTNNLQATLSASYEIDFWGKNRAALRAAEETAVASRYDREVVGLTTPMPTSRCSQHRTASRPRATTLSAPAACSTSSTSASRPAPLRPSKWRSKQAWSTRCAPAFRCSSNH
jgi:outer membrane protein TolC